MESSDYSSLVPLDRALAAATLLLQAIDPRLTPERLLKLVSSPSESSAAGPHLPDQMYSLTEVSQVIRRSKASLSRDIHAGRIRAVKIGGNYKVTKAEVDRLMTS